MEAFALPGTHPGRTKLYDVAVDDDGGVWLAAADRVLEFRGREFLTVALPDLPSDIAIFPNICRIKYSKASRRIWTANAYNIFFREQGGWQGFPQANVDLRFRKLEDMLEPCKDEIWIGSKMGVSRYLGGKWEFRCALTRPHMERCNQLAADANGNIWAGTDGGLIRFSICPFLESQAPADVFPRRVEGVVVLGEKRVFATIPGSGIYTLGSEADRLAPIGNPMQPWIEKACNAVWGDERVWWYGVQGRGLWRFLDGKMEQSLYWGTPRTEDKGLHVSAILETPGGHFWVGTSDGLMECHEPRGAMRLLPVGVMEPVKTLYEDRDGALWCGYVDGGLLRIGTNGTQSAYSQHDGLPGYGVIAVCRDGDGVLWLGGREGLVRWEEGGQRAEGRGHRAGSRTLFTAAQGLPEGSVVQVVPDEQGGLWLGTASGIARLDRRELARAAAGEDVPLTIRLLDRDDGRPREECTGGLLLKGWQPFHTNLWFGTSAGLVQINPALIPPPGKAPQVVFESLRADGREQVSENALDALARGAFPASVRLPPGARRIVIGFSALDCARPERARFRYKLGEGGWSPLSSERTVVFESLSPGRYPFRVTALGSDGAWNLEGAVLELKVMPWFWQTRWFAAGVMALVALAAALLMRGWLRRRYRRRMAELEHQNELQEERSRISRDLHDEIGSKLSRLSFLGALLQHASGSGDEPVRIQASEMAATAAETISAFDDIVWAASPRHDSLHSLVDHICRHAEAYFAGSSVACHFTMADSLPNWPIQPKIRNALFLTVKEALGNVLKHSQGSVVDIAVLVREKRLQISVSDNGIGFDSGDAKQRAGDVHGNGLRNMRERLAAIGGACEIESAPGRGTRVVMEWEAR